jgi:hypothetical protein
MYLLQLLTGHEHYGGVPHEREADKLLIQTCYGWADRRVKADLQPFSSPEQPVSIAIRSSAHAEAGKAA